MKVIGLGDNVVDKYEHLRLMFPGGNALNFAVFAKKLGIDSAFLGAFGDDPEGHHVEESAASLGIDLSHCRHYKGENGCARVKLIDGDRVFQGSNRCGVLRTVGLNLLEDDFAYLANFDLIHSSIYSFSEQYLEELKKRGAVISFDFSNNFTEEYLERTLPFIDYPIFSCSHLTEDQMKELMNFSIEKGARLVLCTRGAEGAWVMCGDQIYHQPPHLVEAKDTMAAGDSFLTCFLISLLSTEASLSTSVRMENALECAAHFAAQQCLVQGSWGFGKPY